MPERPDIEALLPPPDVPLDQTVAYLHWEGGEPPSQERREAWDFRLIRFLGGGWRRKLRRSSSN